MERHAEDMRERIVRAAIEAFADKGFIRTPLQEVAKKAGVSKGLIFWYFRSKNELIVEVARRCLPHDVLESCLSAGLRGEELLRCIAERYMEKYGSERMKRLLLYSLALINTELEVREMLSEICDETIEKVALRVYGRASPRELAAIRIFLGGLLCYTLRPPAKVPREVYIERLLELARA